MLAENAVSRFDEKVLSAQSHFRAVMDAMAHPGRIVFIAARDEVSAPMMRATAALARALFDHDTPIWRDAAMSGHDVTQWLRFHTDAPLADDSERAAFALIGDGEALGDLEAFAHGTAEYPDHSTTLIVQTRSLSAGARYTLSGPGIAGSRVIRADLQLRDLLARLAKNVLTFPRGIDIVLVNDDAIMAIPRTTRVFSTEG